MMSTSPSLCRLIRAIAPIRDPQMHRAPAERLVLTEAPDEVVLALRQLMVGLNAEGYRAAYAAVVRFLMGDELHYSRASTLYRAAARGEAFGPVRFLLLRTPPMLKASLDDVLTDLDLIDIPLGRRKSMARGHQRDVLLRLATDPTPPVVEILLDNPKLLEPDVVRMASRRPNMSGVLDQIAGHRRWAGRYGVQHALVQNPYTSTSLAVALTPFLGRLHLAEVGADARLHQAVRETAKTLLECRGGRRA